MDNVDVPAHATGTGRLAELLFVVVLLVSVAAVGSVAYQQATTPTTPVEVVEVNADQTGAEAATLQNEYVVLRNTGEDPLRMASWQLTDGERAYTFSSGFVLDPGETVTVHSESGQNTARDRYWGAGRPVWDVGDTVVLTTADGTRVLSYEVGPHGA